MLQRIYEARDTIEASLIKGLLEQEGIESWIDGQYLQGGIGELPAFGIVGISVEVDDVSTALKIVSDYDAGKFSIHDVPSK
ncbi:MAG: DUF2007 domain-containing protein [Gammaproteobacteria bacterium]|nr:DUF2007 domain-containing protein [Gammaproteobacteria bacterium]